MKSGIVSTLAALLVLVPAAHTQQVAATPPMGWNSWNHFAGKVDDAGVRAAADAMVSSGMKDAGYTYINIDDTWEGDRDAQGNITTNKKFPDMKALADYVHSKGLKIGIYSSPGALTCAKFAGSLDHEQQDANTYAAWGIDYLKYDLCGLGVQMKAAPNAEARHKIMYDAYVKMRDALSRQDRPPHRLLALPVRQRRRLALGSRSRRQPLAHHRRHLRQVGTAWKQIGFSQAGLSKFAGPGHWNDPDMLEIGNGGMTADEYRTHMSLWSILAAPLLAGNDLSTMTPETVSILANKEVIALDQDKLGKQGDRVWAEGPLEIWTKPLANGDLAVAVFNRMHDDLTTQLDVKKLGFANGAKARDLWKHEDLPRITAPYPVTLKKHSVLLLRLSH